MAILVSLGGLAYGLLYAASPSHLEVITYTATTTEPYNLVAIEVFDTTTLASTSAPEENTLQENLVGISEEIEVREVPGAGPAPEQEPAEAFNASDVFAVPFYSQFADITQVSWQKVGCGIASLAMLIDFHTSHAIDVDKLLEEGIAADAYLDNAGWTHAGLIGLSKAYGLTGSSNDLSSLGAQGAFTELTRVVAERPVMASVHYTFDPKNPIPHLVVVTGIEDGLVYYNDPSEARGGGSIPEDTFLRAWKKRYIDIYPAS